RIKVGRTSYVALTSSLPGSDPRLNASLVALRSYDELAGPYRFFSSTFTLLILLALVLAGVLARAFATGLAKPLDSLVRSAQVVRDGQWPEALEVEREDEIGFLQSVFNDMTATLKKSQERILGLVDTDPLTELDNH